VVEERMIMEKSGQYDVLQMKQAVMTETVDSIYYYSMLLNSDDVHINHSLMYNMLSMRGIGFREDLAGMNGDDCMVYSRLFSEFGNFLQLKDSIRMAYSDLNMLRDEYVRCINKNRDMTRRLFTGSVY
jgi:hypothetical protein